MQITINEDEYQELMRVKREYEQIKLKINNRIDAVKYISKQVKDMPTITWARCEVETLEELLK